jgi:simple sugar transport system ATP-binding protein
MMAEGLAIQALEKSFGRNHVLRSIALDLPAGQVTVLMGANGAGKSTLVRIICGYHRADAGRMVLDGAPYAPQTAAEAIARGIVTVHQSIDDGVIPDLDVASNLLLDRLADAHGPLFLRAGKQRAEAQTVADSIGLTIDLSARVADISVADRQMIAIARAMVRNPRVLILDEPTSSLSTTEAERLFTVVDRLRAQGVAVLYISHRMSDIRRIGDRIVTMRDGRISGLFEGPSLDYEGAVTAMLGHAITDVDIEVALGGGSILGLNGIVLKTGAAPFDLTLRDGEVVAITGLLGAGKSKLAEIIYGLSRPLAGRMTLSGRPYAPRNPADAVAQGVFLSPKDRASNAVIRGFDIADNLTLPFLGAFSRLSFLLRKRQDAAAQEMVRQIGIVCQSTGDDISTLSGGNQQKVMIGRWLLERSRVLLLDEPFQGVDIGARRDIARHIRASAQGRATIVFAAELDEAFEVADRIIVLNEGNLVGEHINKQVDLAALVAQVTGPIARSVHAA